MGRIIKPVGVCLSACLCVRLTVAFLDRFSPRHRQKNPKGRTNFVRVNIAPPFDLFCPPNPHFRPRGPESPYKYQVILLSALHVRESPKFSRPLGNLGRGTRW